jgi:hypothetical protein
MSTFRVITAALVALLALQVRSQAQEPALVRVIDRSARDFTLFVSSDTHVGTENPKADPPVTSAQTLARLRKRLDAMSGLVGKPWPKIPGTEAGSPPPGMVAAPRALLLLGDLVDGHPEPAGQLEQWTSFDKLFPATGLELGGAPVPVIAGAGNHDGPVAGPLRQGLVARNRWLLQAGQLKAISANGVHGALAIQGVHFLNLNLCPADTTDTETPFRFGEPGTGSWNDPQGAFSFLKDYLVKQVGTSGEPVVLMQHYGFDGFSLNDWNWWTPKQRRALYELIADYNVVAILHGHNHHAEHYRWPDPKQHSADLEFLFDGKPPAKHRQYDTLSCGHVCWVLRIRGDQLIAAHFKDPDWSGDPAGVFVKNLTP